jgi:hypothetical protein
MGLAYGRWEDRPCPKVITEIERPGSTVAGRGSAQSGPGARWTNHLQTPQVKTSIHDFAVSLGGGCCRGARHQEVRRRAGSRGCIHGPRRLFDPGVDPPGPWQPHGRSPRSQMPGWVAPLAWSRDAPEPRNAVNAWRRARACPTARCLAPQILDGDRPRLILDTPRGFSAPRCDGTLDWEVCLADVGMTGIGARCTCPVVPACRFLRAALRGYSQMYSSAMAPSRHFATVTIRP